MIHAFLPISLMMVLKFYSESVEIQSPSYLILNLNNNCKISKNEKSESTQSRINNLAIATIMKMIEYEIE